MSLYFFLEVKDRQVAQKLIEFLSVEEGIAFSKSNDRMALIRDDVLSVDDKDRYSQQTAQEGDSVKIEGHVISDKNVIVADNVPLSEIEPDEEVEEVWERRTRADKTDKKGVDDVKAMEDDSDAPIHSNDISSIGSDYDSIMDDSLSVLTDDEDVDKVFGLSLDDNTDKAHESSSDNVIPTEDMKDGSEVISDNNMIRMDDNQPADISLSVDKNTADISHVMKEKEAIESKIEDIDMNHEPEVSIDDVIYLSLIDNTDMKNSEDVNPTEDMKDGSELISDHKISALDIPSDNDIISQATLVSMESETVEKIEMDDEREEWDRLKPSIELVSVSANGSVESETINPEAALDDTPAVVSDNNMIRMDDKKVRTNVPYFTMKMRSAMMKMDDAPASDNKMDDIINHVASAKTPVKPTKIDPIIKWNTPIVNSDMIRMDHDVKEKPKARKRQNRIYCDDHDYLGQPMEIDPIIKYDTPIVINDNDMTRMDPSAKVSIGVTESIMDNVISMDTDKVPDDNDNNIDISRLAVTENVDSTGNVAIDIDNDNTMIMSVHSSDNPQRDSDMIRMDDAPTTDNNSSQYAEILDSNVNTDMIRKEDGSATDNKMDDIINHVASVKTPVKPMEIDPIIKYDIPIVNSDMIRMDHDTKEKPKPRKRQNRIYCDDHDYLGQAGVVERYMKQKSILYGRPLTKIQAESCQKCGYKFPSSHMLSKEWHAMKHTNIEAYECTVDGCGYRSSYVFLMNEHGIKEHNGRKLNTHRNRKLSIEEKRQLDKITLECYPKSSMLVNQDEPEAKKQGYFHVQCKVCFSLISGPCNNMSHIKKEHAVTHIDFMLYKCNEEGCEFGAKFATNMKWHVFEVHKKSVLGDEVWKIQLSDEQEFEIQHMVMKCFD